MSKRSKDWLKGRFRQGAYPTEEDFGSVLDSYRHVDDEVEMSSVRGLPTALNGKFDRKEGNALREEARGVTEACERVLHEAVLVEGRLERALSALESGVRPEVVSVSEVIRLGADDFEAVKGREDFLSVPEPGEGERVELVYVANHARVVARCGGVLYGRWTGCEAVGEPVVSGVVLREGMLMVDEGNVCLPIYRIGAGGVAEKASKCEQILFRFERFLPSDDRGPGMVAWTEGLGEPFVTWCPWRAKFVAFSNDGTRDLSTEDRFGSLEHYWTWPGAAMMGEVVEGAGVKPDAGCLYLCTSTRTLYVAGADGSLVSATAELLSRLVSLEAKQSADIADMTVSVGALAGRTAALETTAQGADFYGVMDLSNEGVFVPQAEGTEGTVHETDGTHWGRVCFDGKRCRFKLVEMDGKVFRVFPRWAGCEALGGLVPSGVAPSARLRYFDRDGSEWVRDVGSDALVNVTERTTGALAGRVGALEGLPVALTEDPGDGAPEAAEPDLEGTVLRKSAQALTAAERGQVLENLGLDVLLAEAERAVFNKLWVERGRFKYGGKNIYFSTYDPENAPDPAKPYMLNELWFSDNEAVEILETSHPKYCAAPLSYGHTYPTCKTVFPTVVSGMNGTPNYQFCTTFVNIRLLDGYMSKPDGLFSGCPSLQQNFALERILTPIAPAGNVTSTFNECTKLYDLRLALTKAACTSVNLANLPLWSLASAQYMAANKTTTVAVVVTVHANVFAKLTGDTSNVAAAALTEEELAAWGAVLDAAAAKNITFTTN